VSPKTVKKKKKVPSRYVQVAGVTAAPTTLTVASISRAGQTTTTTTTAKISATDTGTGIWGPTHSYAFTLTFPAARLGYPV